MLETMFLSIARHHADHAHGTEFYENMARMARDSISPLFGDDGIGKGWLGPFGVLELPYVRLGSVDTMDLLNLDELIIFAFYNRNRTRYTKALDLGANMGIHSLCMARCYWNVRAFEPDPEHFRMLRDTLRLNSAKDVEAFNCAVSTKNGEEDFVRVLGNTTANHLAGSRACYGETQKIRVNTVAVSELFEWADLVKMDVEGHERQLICELTPALSKTTDVICEVGSAANAAAIHDHCTNIGANMFSQKIGWGRSRTYKDLPFSSHEGSLFITCADAMPW